MKMDTALCEVKEELLDATEEFGSFSSPHEGLAIILEEYEELKAEVFRQFDMRSIAAFRKEACHVAAMAVRFMVDLT